MAISKGKMALTNVHSLNLGHNISAHSTMAMLLGNSCSNSNSNIKCRNSSSGKGFQGKPTMTTDR